VPTRLRRPQRIPSTVHLSRTGDEVEAVVERIVPGGYGLAHADGRTIFISQAAPGDRLRVRIFREQGRVAHASIVEILEPGPDRVDPPYPPLTRCGADFQHLRYETQLAAKSGIIGDSLRRNRIGRICASHSVPLYLALSLAGRLATRPGSAGTWVL
jgi:tRNA/tmRNA/rRNA uracil-C5-methylase (TrmA/RlmC/RlmD family)